MMKSTRINYLKTIKKLHRQYGYSIGTKMMQKKIAVGILPVEFLEFHKKERRVKMTLKQARQRFKNNHELRNLIYRRDGRWCKRCGSTVRLTIDHIKPVFLFPHLANESMNMQILCQSCNSKKATRI